MKRSLRTWFAALGLGLVMGLGAFSVFPAVAFAEDTVEGSLEAVGDQTGLGNEDPRIIIGTIIRYALGFLGVILVCFVVYGGFVWMTAAGNPERVDKAKQILINATIGLIIVLMSWAIASFVINALLGATGGRSGGSGSSGGGSSSGGGLGGGSGSVFEVTGLSPEGEVSIRNVVVRVTFSKTVDEESVEGNLRITDASGTPVEGTFAISGNSVRFTPSAACPAPNTDRFCFDENADFTIAATNTILSSNGTSLTCSTGSPCTATFRSGTLVDTEDPTASIVIPESGDGVPTLATMDVQVSATDDAGVSVADFLIEDEWQDSVSSDGTLTETLIDSVLSTNSFTNGERYQVSVTVFDIAGNEDADSVTVRARPEWCFNGVQDADLGEEGIDCGGSSSGATYCGTCDGGSCVEDGDCSSGSCVDGFCAATPTISMVTPISGAVGTYVTISGSDFGTRTGSVLFLNEAGTGTVEATILTQCAEGWSDSQIVIAVPEGAGDGPIVVTTQDGVIETTNDDAGVLVPNFDVNDVVMPSLCSLSARSGEAQSALALEGANFGSSRGTSTVDFGVYEAGSYTAWADSDVQVTVPSRNAGTYDIAVTVGGNTSNVIAFTLTEPEPAVSTITDISPASGGPGQYVTISGTNFGSRIGRVTFEGADGSTATARVDFPDACGDDFWSADAVTVIVPDTLDNGDDLAAGSYTVSVTNSSGTTSTETSFTVTDAAPTPGICSITASADVGDTVTIIGDNFGGESDTVTFFNGVANRSATRWTNSVIDVAVPAGAVTGPVTATVAGVESNPANVAVGATTGGGSAATVSAAYAWSFSTGEIAVVPEIVVECSADAVSAVPNASFSSAGETCVNAVVYAEFTTLMNEASVENAVTVAACTGAGTDPCETMENVTGTATALSSADATRVTWIPSGDFAVSTTYRVTIATTALSVDAIGLARDVTWDFTTADSTADCVVDRVTVAPSKSILTVDGETTGFSANAGTGCIVVDSSDYAWDWSVDSYSYVDFNTAVDRECTGDPSACATLEAFAEGTTVVTATAINAEGGGTISDDATLTVNFSDPYIVGYWPNCTEACTNAEIGASFNIPMYPSDIVSGDHVVLYSCGNELCTSLTVVDANPSCVYSDSAQTECEGFAFDGLSLTAGKFYRVVVSGDIRSESDIPLIRTNYGSDYSWTFRVREDSTLCSVERITMSPSSAVATTIGETAAFNVEAYGASDSCSASGQRLVAADFAWDWRDAENTVFPAIADDEQNASTEFSTAAWYTQSGSLLDGGVDEIAQGCSESCTPIGSAVYEAVCGDGVLDQDVDGSGEECDDGNTTDNDGCSSTCVNEGSLACSFTCSSTGATCSADSECIETCNTSTSLCTVSGATCTTNNDCPYVAATCGTSGTACCGNGSIEHSAASDIAEDCDDGNVVDGDGCSASCLAEGSAAIGATCGNNDIAFDAVTLAGEECDDGNNASGDGCSRLCLREGSRSSAATGGAECGDGIVTAPYETCDDGGAIDGDGCSSMCVREGLPACTSSTELNCCGNTIAEVNSGTGAGEDCDGGEGCSDECTFEGSSVAYSAPSVCGDGVVGIGEYAMCEAAGGSGDGRADAVQVAFITDEASLEVSEATSVAIANIAVTEPSSNLTATAALTLSCVAETDQDCSDPETHAVGVSRCCVPRPTLQSTTPVGSAVCRNAAITATFDQKMDTTSFITSVTEGDTTTKSSQMYVALNLRTGELCPAGYTTSQYLALSWMQRTLAVLKIFFLGPVAEAAATTDCVLPITSFTQTALEGGLYKISARTNVALEANASYTLVIRGDDDVTDDVSEGVRSSLGGALNGSLSVDFVTGSEICTLDDVVITDTNDDSPYVFTASGETHTFNATAMSYSGRSRQEIVGVPEVYDWTWSSWSGSDADLFTVAQDTAAPDTATVTVLSENGDAIVTAVATIAADSEGNSEGETVVGDADVTAYLCENTWPDLSAFPWSDDATGAANGLAAEGAGYMNFALSYCQDFGDSDTTADDLPDVHAVLTERSSAPDVLKEYLFSVDSTSTTSGADSAGDAVGVRVISNADFLSPLAWYEAKGFAGSPSVTTVDGFQAVEDGRSAYIAAANSTTSGLYSNIVVVTYNEGASEETRSIYEQMLESLTFLLNVSNDGTCSASGNACTQDDQCTTESGEYCVSDKLAILRDTDRLADMKDISIFVDAYGEANRTCSSTASQSCTADADCPDSETCEAIVPALSSGTAVRSLASSVWSSWTSTLGGALGDDLPTDPLNVYAACDGYDSATCVNQTTGAYMCPVDSHVYHYRSVGDRAYELAVDLEYTRLPWVNDIDADATDAVTIRTSSYCDGDVYGTSSFCGDGIIGTNSDGTTEVCELGDLSASTCTMTDGGSGVANASCNSSCTGYELSADAVCLAGTCGDGVVDASAGETCDDGALNGAYGYCGSFCTYDDAEYCGDGVVSGGEACDCGDSTASTELTESRPYGGAYGTCAARNGVYSAGASATCSWDCAGPAAYCGDASVDVGESCDGDADSWEGALCSDGITPCSTDGDCSSGDVCGDVHGACPAATICVGGSFDGYPCANFEWPSSVTSTFSSSYLSGFALSMRVACGVGADGDASTTADNGSCGGTPVYQTARTRGCDDGDASSMCGWESWNYCNYNGKFCGNGVVDGTEECDDGNDVATDACTTSCTWNICGDGYLYDTVEQCDEGTGNGGGCSSAYGSTCTACSTTCRYTVSSGDFCGDGIANGREYCDGADVPYVWYDDGTNTTNGTCDTLGDTWEDGSVTYTCRSVGICNGGVNNGEYCTSSTGLSGLTPDVAYCRSSSTAAGECVMPVCGADCAATCPASTSSLSLLLTSNQPGADTMNDVDVYSYSSSSTSSYPNAATIEVPACTIAGNLVADVDFANVERPDMYVVFVTDTSGSMGWEFGASSSDGDDIDERLDVAKESINEAIGTLFDEFSSKMNIGLVQFASTATTDTSRFLGSTYESVLNGYVDAYSASGGTETDDGLYAALTLLDSVTDTTNVAKMIVLLSDGQPGSESAVNDAVMSVLQSEGVELYSLALTSTDSLETDMNRWSSNTICDGTETTLNQCDVYADSLTDLDSSEDYNDNNLLDYSYAGSTSEEVSVAYESIIDSILNGTASLISSLDGEVVVNSGSVSDRHNIVLPWPSNFACDGVSAQQVPIQVVFRGEGTVNISNVRVEYCAP